MDRLIITTAEELETLLRNVLREQIAPPTQITQRDNLSLDETVEYLTEIGCPVSKKTLYKLTSASRISYKKFCGKLIFSRKEVEMWAQQQIVDVADSSDGTTALIKSVKRKRRT